MNTKPNYCPVIAGLIWNHFTLSMPILPTASASSSIQRESKCLLLESSGSLIGYWKFQIFCNRWCWCYMLSVGCIRACLHQDLLPPGVSILLYIHVWRPLPILVSFHMYLYLLNVQLACEDTELQPWQSDDCYSQWGFIHRYCESH